MWEINARNKSAMLVEEKYYQKLGIKGINIKLIINYNNNYKILLSLLFSLEIKQY